MATAISRPTAAALTLVGLAVAGCGGNSAGGSSTVGGSGGSTVGGSGGGFAWVRPGPPPAGWQAATVAGAVMPYPPGWKRAHGDKGTVTAMLHDSQQQLIGYLNITPRQGTETPANFARFRVAHNADEGERGVKRLAAAQGLRFRTGRGACVRDSYTTKTARRFVELACLIVGRGGSWVIVGASPPQAWAAQSPAIERAISAFST